MAHTPGPWKAFNRSSALGWSVKSEMGTVAEGSSQGDAHLIAAAPELLEALKDLVNEYVNDLKPLQQMVEKACAAIAKAEGRFE